ncbi:hypothetical protein GCK32_010380 [Trichostrongylus colubriformis]|uniref:Uncharacterized protein n=1 Tax=Trichostrongylus colubriformis TaxID=6319 RepID=A0AAN8FJR6_TRICO
MERLIFALTVAGATLACSPDVIGKGSNIASVHLITMAKYETSKVEEYMDHFSDTKIKENSKPIGDFMGLESANISGFFSYKFYLADCDCEKVRLWMDKIVKDLKYFKDKMVDCYVLESTAPTPPAPSAPTAPPAPPAPPPPPAPPGPSAPPAPPAPTAPPAPSAPPAPPAPTAPPAPPKPTMGQLIFNP